MWLAYREYDLFSEWKSGVEAAGVLCVGCYCIFTCMAAGVYAGLPRSRHLEHSSTGDDWVLLLWLLLASCWLVCSKSGVWR